MKTSELSDKNLGGKVLVQNLLRTNANRRRRIGYGAEAWSALMLRYGRHGSRFVSAFCWYGRKRSGGRTYGSSLSTADVKDDVHFAGAGVVRVRRPVGFIVICQ